MRVLICGGVKTINIVRALQPRFKAGTVDFVVINNITGMEIKNWFSRGEQFDRAVIIEQSWTNDGYIQDEYEMRKAINWFASAFRQRAGAGATCVFITTNEAMATMVAEETIEINRSCKVLIKEPPYTVSFFSLVVTYDLSSIPDTYVFDFTKASRNEQSEADIVIKQPLNKADEVEVNLDEPSTSSSKHEVDDLDNDFFGNVHKDFGGIVEFDIENTEEIEKKPDLGYEYTEDNFEKSSDETDDYIEDETDNTETINIEDIEEDSSLADLLDSSKAEEVEKIVEEVDAAEKEDKTDEGDIEVLEGFAEPVEEPCKPKELKEQEGNSKEPIEPHAFFDEEVYKRPTTKARNERVEIKPTVAHQADALITLLNTFKNRGSSLVVTGGPASGKSLLAFNIANVVAKLGYQCLLVDFDLFGRTQAYLSKEAYEAVHSGDTAKTNLLAAINSSHGKIGRYVDIISPGFHILTNGLAGDVIKPEQFSDKQKVIRFDNTAKSSYNFIVYDMPFEFVDGLCSDIVLNADNVVITIDASTWGVMQALLLMGNVDNMEVQEALFCRSQVCFTKVRESINKVLGRQVKDVYNILRLMDTIIVDLLGIEPEFLFSDIRVCGVIPYNEQLENLWFGRKQYSDISEGYDFTLRLLESILLKH